MDQLPPDILNYFMNYLDFVNIGRLALTCKYFNNNYSKYCKNINKKLRIIHKLFTNRKKNFFDLLNKNRPGYLINFNKIYKNPENIWIKESNLLHDLNICLILLFPEKLQRGIYLKIMMKHTQLF